LSPIAGQYLTFDGANFDFLIPPTAPVTSVNGQTGVVSLDTDDVPEGSRLYFTEERVDDRVNNLLVAGANITLTYNDPSNTLTIAAASGSGSIPDGTAALPGLAFTSDPDTGLYRPGANTIGVAVGGVKVGEFNSNGAYFPGQVVQVVSTTKTDTFATTSSSFVDITGLSATITPKFTTSKVIVFVSVARGISGDAVTAFELNRDGLPIAIADSGGGVRATMTAYYGASQPTVQINNIAVSYLDSPATTSAITYNLKMRTDGAGTHYVNRNGFDTWRAVSSITLMEVAA
jgi:hypothetical protein